MHTISKFNKSWLKRNIILMKIDVCQVLLSRFYIFFSLFLFFLTSVYSFVVGSCKNVWRKYETAGLFHKITDSHFNSIYMSRSIKAIYNHVTDSYIKK